MFKKESDKKTFTAADIQRYIDGRMPPAERNELERAALSDPFLEDALEGYTALADATGIATPAHPTGIAAPDASYLSSGIAAPNASNMPADLADLRARLADRISPGGQKRGLAGAAPALFSAEGRLGAWLRIAAAVIVIGAAGILLYVRNRRPETARHGLAMKAAEVRGTPGAAAGATPAGGLGAADSAVLGAADSGARGAADSAALASASTNAPIATAGKAPQSPPAPTPLLKKPLLEKPLEKNDADTVPFHANAPLRVSDAPSRVSDTNPVQAYGATTLRAQRLGSILPLAVMVTDSRNQPIVGATVQTEPSGRITTTDQNGYFHLPTTAAGDSIVVTAIGFEKKKAAIGQHIIQLSDATSNLNDVVVIGYGVAKSKKTTRWTVGAYRVSNDTTELQPIDGWSSFNYYVSNHAEIPSEVKQKDLHGDVVLSFRVDEDGNPVGISVDKSLCVPCDTEAIRLLKKGPQWRKKNNATGHVKVHF